MSGCSNKVWLKKGSMPGNPAHRKRVLKKASTQPMKILTFWNHPYKRVSKSKNGFHQNGYHSKINQGSGPSRVGSQEVIALYIVSANNP
jgi:hypothetical protein